MVEWANQSLEWTTKVGNVFGPAQTSHAFVCLGAFIPFRGGQT